MCLHSQQSFIVRDSHQEGYSLNPEAIETLTLSRSLPGLKNPYADQYVPHFEFLGEQLLALENITKTEKSRGKKKWLGWNVY